MSSLFRFTDAPSCKNHREQLYGALKQETVLLECEVDSNPKPNSFHWTFNNSGDSSLVSSSRYSQSGFTSVIKYTPNTDMDYGTLACWAKNPVGHQKRPCIYQIVAAGEKNRAEIDTCVAYFTWFAFQSDSIRLKRHQRDIAVRIVIVRISQ